MMVIVFGLPGSGKSYFASRLAKAIGADYINSDLVRREMLVKRTYSEQEKHAVYEKMRMRFKEAIQVSKSVVIDATFYTNDLRQEFIEASGGRIAFIEVTATESVIRERLLKPRLYSEADFAVYQEIKSQWEPFAGEHLTLESRDNNIDTLLAKAKYYLQQGNDQPANK